MSLLIFFLDGISSLHLTYKSVVCELSPLVRQFDNHCLPALLLAAQSDLFSSSFLCVSESCFVLNQFCSVHGCAVVGSLMPVHVRCTECAFVHKRCNGHREEMCAGHGGHNMSIHGCISAVEHGSWSIEIFSQFTINRIRLYQCANVRKCANGEFSRTEIVPTFPNGCKNMFSFIQARVLQFAALQRFLVHTHEDTTSRSCRYLAREVMYSLNHVLLCWQMQWLLT